MQVSTSRLCNVHNDSVSSTFVNDDVRPTLQVIAAKEAGEKPPVRNIEGSTFMYIRHKDMYFVAVARANANAGEAA
jgi:hypothetical protein